MMTMASPTQPDGKLCPVAMRRAKAQRRTPQAMTISDTTKAISTQWKFGPNTGAGMKKPRLDSEKSVADLDGVLDVGQRGEHGEIEEQDDQQRRNVAQEFDIDCGDRADQPVGREPRDADDHAEDSGDDDGEQRHNDCVEQPGQHHEAVGALARRVEERGHVEAGALAQEAEPGSDAATAKIGRRCCWSARPDRANDDHHQEHLEEDAAYQWIVVPAVPGDVQPSGIGNSHTKTPDTGAPPGASKR